MAELPDSDAPALFDEALAMLANAAQTPGLDVHLYVSICQNRANCYMGLANVHYPRGTDYLDSALAVCQVGIKWLPKTHATQHYASLYSTISTIHNEYATHMDVNIQQQLEAALDANNNVLLHLGETEDKMNYARVLMNRANIYSSLAELIDVDQRGCLQKSVACLNESLEYRTPELVPLEYSWTQHNLANTLMQLSRLEGEHRRDRLTHAVAASNQALRFRTVHDVPEHHAMTQYFFALIYREIADANVDEPADAHAACVAGINAVRAAKAYYQSHNAHIYAGTCDIEASLLTRLARSQTGTPRHALLQEALTLSEAAIDIYMGSNALEDAGEVYLTQAAIFWQQHLDTPLPNDLGIVALQCSQDAYEFLVPSQRPQIVCASQIAMGELLFATSNPIDGLTQALPHVWQGYTLATTLHDAPHIQQATTILRQMQAQSDPVTFVRIWNQTIASPMPIWFTH
jgi:tetratricopeptide (TPR) repeat protein